MSNKGPKAENVEKMFDSIASDYDMLNHLLSLNIDKIWRKRAIKEVRSSRGSRLDVLDLACGTGDFSIEIARNTGASVTGLDLSEGMLEVMARKVDEKGLRDRIHTIHGNCEKMSFPDDSFDVVTIGFGIRNFENREVALREILRVLRPGGKLIILELSIPENPLLRALYKFYFLKILPRIGGAVSGDRASYNYLPASVLNFPGRKEWMATMSSCGYSDVRHRAFSFGICRMYIGIKSL